MKTNIYILLILLKIIFFFFLIKIRYLTYIDLNVQSISIGSMNNGINGNVVADDAVPRCLRKKYIYNYRKVA